MIRNKLIIISILFSFCLIKCDSIEWNIIKAIACKLYECCDSPYVLMNFTNLEILLRKNVFGQPLVINTTLSTLRGHFGLENPEKALVLSFHGVTGSGKNYVSQYIASSFFKKGTSSKFYKYFSSTRDFPHNERIHEYKELLIKTIENTVKQCEYSLFVFDEMDKTPVGLMDTIRAYIDSNKGVGGLNFRHSVFVFLSNTASKEIAEATLQLDLKNINRDNFELKIFQEVIHNHAFNHKTATNKGLWHSTLISNHLIDDYVPFLPLERVHVKQCVIVEFEKHLINSSTHPKIFEEYIDRIADQIIYEPPGYHKYASSGCKRIGNLVRKFIVEERLKKLEL